jgi:hypothetical protein
MINASKLSDSDEAISPSTIAQIHNRLHALTFPAAAFVRRTADETIFDWQNESDERRRSPRPL